MLAVVALAGCAGTTRTAWDGRRGYDGNGDYGYDLSASRSEARDYRARAAQSYPAPGSPADPWGPYIREASTRFQVPELWIREVMRQESGGNQFNADGSLITSSAGAMGLMQVMPRTYDMLQERYSLGPDPYEPRANILAGTAYIREMYDRYGSPAFLAAYNAGPDRLDSHLADGSPLPDETVNYLASVAPRLGSGTSLSGPLAPYGGGSVMAKARTEDRTGVNAAYAGGGLTGFQYASIPRSLSDADDPSLRAFDGGGLVTPEAPTGVLTRQAIPSGPIIPVTGQAAAVPQPPTTIATTFGNGTVTSQLGAARSIVAPTTASEGYSRNWAIQIGAFPDPSRSAAAIAIARARAGDLLLGSEPTISSVQRGGTLYRARLVGLSAARAAAACARLAENGIECFTVPSGL